jgi:hypothetical protein
VKPLDLSNARPRGTRAELAGILFLPRSIDKVRASFPGGNLNGYTIEGFTTRMLENLGITVDAFTAAVERAENDEDVARFVREHAVSGGAEAWNEFALHREVYGGDRAEALADYPWLADHPEITLSIDFLQYMEDHNLDV